MILNPVDNIDGLFTIENVYDLEILESFLQEDFTKIPSKPLVKQEHMILRKTFKVFPESSKWLSLINSINIDIIKNLGYEISDSALWLDNIGFNMGSHIDNDAVVASMQVYLKDGPENFGTTFFNLDNTFSYLIPFKKNCGYIMINKGQRHGLLSPITEDRWSIYNWLTKLG